MRLVREYHPDLVQSTHLHLAGELEQESNYRDAEKHYVAAEDWKAAVNMYRSVDMWEDAYRVCYEIVIEYDEIVAFIIVHWRQPYI